MYIVMVTLQKPYQDQFLINQEYKFWNKPTSRDIQIEVDV